MIKKILFVGFLIWSISARGVVAGVVFTYDNEKDVSAHKISLGYLTEEGVLSSAETALNSGGQLIIGLRNGDLMHGDLLRLDNAMGVALFEVGGAIKDKKLLKSHRQTLSKFSQFFSLKHLDAPSASSVVEGMPGSDDPFRIKINDVVVGDEPITLPMKRKQTEFRLEIIRPIPKKAWSVDLLLESDPPLLFWKKGRKKTLNDVPTAKFRYGYQSMLKPLKKGRSFKLTVEVSSIKSDSYEWSIKIKSKEEKFEQKVKIRFEQK